MVRQAGLAKKHCMRLTWNTVVALMGSVLLVLASTPGFAYGSSHSDYQYKTVFNRTYKYNSEVLNRNIAGKKTTEACANVMWTNGATPDSGYMGAQARLLNSKGKVVRQSAMKYSSIDGQINMIAYSKRIATTNTYYISQSKIKLYNGNGYNTYFANKSPKSKAPAKGGVANSNESEVELETVAMFGKMCTVGNAYQHGEDGDDPDLIEVVGECGTEGYAKSSDMTISADNPDEAVSEMEEAGDTYEVPVYNLDGEIIDTFIVG